MLTIGLTGNIGSGKTTIARLFEILGVPVFYADSVAKSFLNAPDVVSEVAQALDKMLVDKDGCIDRKLLAGIVFTDAKKLATLNEIIHPRVRNSFIQWLANLPDTDYAIMEAAILVESGSAERFDKIIVVTAPLEHRIARVMLRDKVSREDVIARINNQMPEAKLAEYADFLLINDNQGLLLPKVLETDKILRKLARYT